MMASPQFDTNVAHWPSWIKEMLEPRPTEPTRRVPRPLISLRIFLVC